MSAPASVPGSESEFEIKALCDAERWSDAATAIVRRYGRELLEYLVAIARSEVDGSDAFSLYTEDVWRGLPRFRWEASVRTWSYALARNALHRVRRQPHRRPGRAIALSDAPEVGRLANQIRTTTITYLQARAQDEIAALRAELSPDDQAILILRIDRGLPWLDVARAFADEGEALDGAALTRRAATLRKRFGRIKADLKALVQRHRKR